MHFFDAAVLGVVEGLTEFLPVSSTGHLILAGRLLQLPSTEFLKSFEIVIQLGAIAAVLVLFWRSFLDIEVLKRLAVAFIPTGIIGLALYPFIKTYLLGNDLLVLIALLAGGAALIVFEYLHRERADATEEVSHVTYRQALGIGVCQAVAVVPGVSRSAATIVGGLLVGLKRTTIVEFSFLLAVPTMAAAAGLDLLKSYKDFSAADTGILAVGFIAALLVALFVIRFFLAYVRTHTFIPFGVYRILVSLAFFLFVMSR